MANKIRHATSLTAPRMMRNVGMVQEMNAMKEFNGAMMQFFHWYTPADLRTPHIMILRNTSNKP